MTSTASKNIFKNYGFSEQTQNLNTPHRDYMLSNKPVYTIDRLASNFHAKDNNLERSANFIENAAFIHTILASNAKTADETPQKFSNFSVSQEMRGECATSEKEATGKASIDPDKTRMKNQLFSSSKKISKENGLIRRTSRNYCPWSEEEDQVILQ